MEFEGIGQGIRPKAHGSVCTHMLGMHVLPPSLMKGTLVFSLS